MGKWEMVRLGDVCDVRDGTHDSPKYVENGFPLITSKNIIDDKIDFNSANLISHSDFEKINKRSKVDIGDILMPMIGTIGNSIIVDVEGNFAIKNVALIKFNTNRVKNTYVNYILKSTLFERYVEQENRGGTQKFLSLGNIRSFTIPLPPLEIQGEIARNLDLASELVNLHKTKLEELDKLIQSVFYDMFGDPVTNEKGWEVEKLGDVSILKAGKNIKANQLHEKSEINKFPCYGGNGIRGYINLFSHEGEYSLIGRQGALCGNVQFVSQKFYVTEHAVVVTLIAKIASKWLYYILKFLDLNRLQTGAAQPGLNIEILNNVDIILPPLLLQQKFADIVTEIETQKAQVQQALDDAQMLYNSLMQEYFE